MSIEIQTALIAVFGAPLNVISEITGINCGKYKSLIRGNHGW